MKHKVRMVTLYTFPFLLLVGVVTLFTSTSTGPQWYTGAVLASLGMLSCIITFALHVSEEVSVEQQEEEQNGEEQV